MKYYTTTPKNKAFYEQYARLVKSLKLSGYVGQLLSFMTAIGGIALIFQNLLSDFLPVQTAVTIAWIVAGVAAFTIELALRFSIPSAVDSILYKRFKGLELYVSILIFLIVGLVGTASIYLSYANSKVIVDDLMEVPALDTLEIQRIQADQAKAVATFQARYSQDSAQLAADQAQQLQLAAAAEAGAVAAAKARLAKAKNDNWRNKGGFGGAIDQAKTELASAEANLARATASLTAQHRNERAQFNGKAEKQLSSLQGKYTSQTAEIKAAHETAISVRNGKASGRGAGLAWFTVIGFVLTLVSIAADRIHKKGSEMIDKVEFEAADTEPHPIREYWEALNRRLRTTLQTAAREFDANTPTAPAMTLPSKPVNWDKLRETGFADIQVDEDAPEDLTVRRRSIGFAARFDERTKAAAQEIATANTRIKQYSDRLAKHKRKAETQAKADGYVSSRTQNAIDNNEQWLKHWQAQAEALKFSQQ